MRWSRSGLRAQEGVSLRGKAREGSAPNTRVRGGGKPHRELPCRRRHIERCVLKTHSSSSESPLLHPQRPKWHAACCAEPTTGAKTRCGAWRRSDAPGKKRRTDVAAALFVSPTQTCRWRRGLLCRHVLRPGVFRCALRVVSDTSFVYSCLCLCRAGRTRSRQTLPTAPHRRFRQSIRLRSLPTHRGQDPRLTQPARLGAEMQDHIQIAVTVHVLQSEVTGGYAF